MTTTTIEAPIAGPGIASRDHNLPSGDELLVMVSKDPALPLTDPAIRDGLVEALQQVTADAPKIADTDADRKAIREAGRKVSSHKNAIDKARLAKTKGLRDEVAAINAVGAEVDGKLQALQDRVEAPLNAWKEAELRRLATVDRVFSTIRDAAQGIHMLPSSAIAERIAQVEALEFPAAVFTEGTMAVEDERDGVLRQLREAKAMAEQREAQEAELAQLRAEREDRERRERDEQMAREAEQRALDRQAQAAEEARLAAAREAQRLVDEANERAAEAQRQAAAERQRIADEQREAERLRQAAIDAEEARKRDQAHRADVHAKAIEAIVALDVPKAKAEKVVMAIAAGNVPAVSIQY